jgi:flagellar biosynthesis protein FlhG
MMDQATELRKLVLRALRERAAETGPPPRFVVVVGGKAGVGVTSLVVNLAVALGEQGARVVIVDADMRHSDVALLCGIRVQTSVADVLSARRDIHEVLQRGPAGVQIVPGLWAPGQPFDSSQTGQQRLLRQFRQLGPHADAVILDGGSGSGPLIRRFCEAADDVLLVSTPDGEAVMDTYARVKTSLHDVLRGRLRLIVNRCVDPQQMADVHRRLEHSLRRFLGMHMDLLGYVPEDPQVHHAGSSGRPFALSAPECPAAHAIQQLAQQMAGDDCQQRAKTA